MPQLLGVEYCALPIDSACPPVLHVVVDTEEEFDWSAPFGRRHTAVTAMGAQEKAQAILHRYGLRPIYVMDYPVATQPEGWRPLRAILERGECVIGAHLHPWVNPPFEEAVNSFNSYAGNLPPALEAAKLEALCDAIAASFGIRPRYYKAGRYGLGPGTIRLLERLEIPVDFSVLPGLNLAGRGGGPDFRHMQPTPYLAGDAGTLSMPMTRGPVGPLAALDQRLDFPAAPKLHVRGILHRTGLMRQSVLTPEGAPLALQCALLRKLAAEGQRVFVLHYHSPSLAPGHTPYVRSEADLAAFLDRIESVCRYFFETLGGRAGDPEALLAGQPQAESKRAA